MRYLSLKLRMRLRELQRLVAQIFNLLYRRFAIGTGAVIAMRVGGYSRRGRLQTCGTADCKSALPPEIVFRKYKVAPRLGTPTVRRRLLERLRVTCSRFSNNLDTALQV
jgi:hypothetical protein